MDFLYKSPLNYYLACGLSLVSIISINLSIRRFITAYQLKGEYASSSWLIRGIRWLLIGLTAATWAAGFYFVQSWLFIIGLVIICQELYEGAILSSALKTGEAIEKGKKEPGINL